VIEEDILNLMDQVEKYQKELVKEKEYLAEEDKKTQKEIQEKEEKLKALKEKVKILEDKKHIKSMHIDKKIFQDYERLVEAKQGVGIVAVRNFVCMGCGMSLPPQVVNEIKMYKEIVHCPMCSRILYLEEDI